MKPQVISTTLTKATVLTKKKLPFSNQNEKKTIIIHSYPFISNLLEEEYQNNKKTHTKQSKTRRKKTPMQTEKSACSVPFFSSL